MVAINCGQGFESGYGTSQGDVERCLLTANLVGVRFGDNYVNWEYENFIKATSSLLLFNTKDVWGRAWDSGDWTHHVAQMDIRTNYLTQADPVHPNNLVWNPAVDASRLAPFLPTPATAVGAGMREGIGSLLAEGVKRAAAKIGKGSADFAMQNKGMTFPGHSARGLPGFALGYATGPRGASHHDARPTGERAGIVPRETLEGKPQYVINVNHLNILTDSMILCHLAEAIWGPTEIKQPCIDIFNAVTGMDINLEQAKTTAERIWNVIRAFAVRRILPVVAVLGFLAAPKSIRDRALSIFSLRDPSNQARIEYARAGARIIADFPLLGTGPDTVDMVFQNPKYGLGDTAKRNVHLHSNVMQIAAERGVVTLLAWLAFLISAFLSLLKLARPRGTRVRSLAAGALAALAAFFAAGFFEFNFGDSEISTLLLFILTLPFAVARLK